MKFRKYLLPTLLTIAVLLSLALSVAMWLNPARYGSRQQNNTKTPAKTESVNKSIGYVYSPVQAVYADQNGNQELLINTSVNTVAEIKHQMHDYQDASLKTISSKSKGNYVEALERPNSFLLNYTSTVTMKMVDAFVNNRFKDLPNYEVDHIVVPTDDSEHLYLLADKEYKIYRISIKKHNLEGLQQIMQGGNIRKVPAAVHMLNNKPNVYTENSFTLQPYRYLVSSQSEDYYVSRLLNGENSQNVRVKKQGNNTSYTDGNNRQLNFNEKQKMVNYSDFQAKPGSLSLTSLLTGGYNNLVTLGVSLDNVRLYDHNLNSHMITYRYFVEGFPVFGNNGQGSITMQNVNTETVRYRFPLTSPQVPIPNGNSTVTMLPTQTVIDRLKELGYKERSISQIHIGYSLKKDSSSMLVKLTPEWYIKYNGKWQSYSQMSGTTVTTN
ncbi:YycH protein [Lentilactobacillus senioris DSM 24302 = JCM 17472]|uniref:YycH protein n=1 Tax=Lentilactobacillus senioris DSM 24302 = JCM 17472 TaxID=1423802 RepID=A0A0R2CR72_9LACO|nr:two-component system activity regulator YycH [Lentilactobacillus senioris]KRM94305.1 YycH protein [Lentilactobacillus senioris DSM 24302 = JCM 17472]